MSIQWSRWWWLFLFLGTVLLPSPTLFATHLPCVTAVANEADPEPLPPGDYLLRVHPELGLHEVLVIEEYPLKTGEVTRRYRRQVRAGDMAPDIETQTPRGADWHFSHVRHIARRVLEVYEERERFTPHFLAGYMENSRRYINDTEYVEVRAGRTGPLLAANRFVLAPYALVDGKREPRGPVVKKLYGADFDRFREPGELQPDSELPRPVRRLPEAHYLHDMDLPLWTWTPQGSQMQCGLEVEMGAYLVEQVGSRDEQEIWKAELWVQLLRLAHNNLFDDGFNYNGLVIYCFADRLGRRVYEPLGFERIGEEPVVAGDGEKWWPLAYFVSSLDKASSKAAEGTGAWLRDGAYFKSRLAKDLNPSVLPAWESILKSLDSDDERESFIAGCIVLRFAELQAIHHATRSISYRDLPRARRAHESFMALNPIMEQVQSALIRLARSPKYETRHRIAHLLTGLVASSSGRIYLDKKTLLVDFICPLLADRQNMIALEVAYVLRDYYSYAEIVEFLGEYSANADGIVDYVAAKSRARASLKSAGLRDAEIDEVVETVHRKMPRPRFDALGVGVFTTGPSFSAGLDLNRASRGKSEVIKNLLILIATRVPAGAP